MVVHKKIRLLCLILAGLMLLGGCAKEEEPEPTQMNRGGLVCVEYTRYDGPFPEDGSGRMVSGVAAMLVLNSSDKFLDRAVVNATVGAHIGTFEVTGLPPGASVWVLEKEGMVLAPGDPFLASECTDYQFHPDAVMSTDMLSVKSKGNALTVTNESDKTLNHVAVYYKTVHPDGNYFGGISYLLSFDTLEPGESVTKQSAHFGEDSRIVRYSFQES